VIRSVVGYTLPEAVAPLVAFVDGLARLPSIPEPPKRHPVTGVSFRGQDGDPFSSCSPKCPSGFTSEATCAMRLAWPPAVVMRRGVTHAPPPLSPPLRPVPSAGRTPAAVSGVSVTGGGEGISVSCLCGCWGVGTASRTWRT
jgi:hypothetical protein